MTCRSAVFTLFLLFHLTSLFAQITESGHTSVSVAPRILSLNSIQDLSFGTVHPSGQDGSVRVFPLSNPNSATGHSAENGVGVSGSPTHGVWEIVGDPHAQVQVNFPSSSISLSDGVNTMIMDQLDAGGQSFVLGANGRKLFAVRATLRVAADQTPGDYTGSYDVTVSYE